jgi:hypothetical protein
MLGEGRHLINVIKSFAVIEALDAMFPDRVFSLTKASIWQLSG